MCSIMLSSADQARKDPKIMFRCGNWDIFTLDTLDTLEPVESLETPESSEGVRWAILNQPYGGNIAHQHPARPGAAAWMCCRKWFIAVFTKMRLKAFSRRHL